MTQKLIEITTRRSGIVANVKVDVDGETDVATVQVPWASLTEDERAVLAEAVRREFEGPPKPEGSDD